MFTPNLKVSIPFSFHRNITLFFYRNANTSLNQPCIIENTTYIADLHVGDPNGDGKATQAYLVHLESDADVGVLQSKEWFEWDDMSLSLLAGTSLIFRIQSQVFFKDKTAYRNVSVSGDIFVRNQLKVLVGTVACDLPVT